MSPPLKSFPLPSPLPASESHIHSLVSVLRFCQLREGCQVGGEEGTGGGGGVCATETLKRGSWLGGASSGGGEADVC